VAYLDFQCPAAYASPESSVATRLVVKLADDYLNELTYPAELAGLSYHLHNTLTGFQVRLLTQLGDQQGNRGGCRHTALEV
jgi:secreted Zn-dependent insulinase-like peptidase